MANPDTHENEEQRGVGLKLALLAAIAAVLLIAGLSIEAGGQVGELAFA